MTRQERYTKVLDYFETNVPVAETELHYTNSFELLVAVILSAQCTDKRVNMVTPALFKDFPDANTMAVSNAETIFSYIRSISYPNNKAHHLVNMAKMLMTDFNNTIPSEIDDLVKLPGVGRKTANVIASVVFNKPTMAVDTHVFRVSARLGLTVGAKNPLQAEQQLVKNIPDALIPKAHHWLILHGRYTCLARTPNCSDCKLTEFCNYYDTKIIKNKTYNVMTKINEKRPLKPIKKTVKKVSASKPVKKATTKVKAIVKTTKANVVKQSAKAAAKKTVAKFVAHQTHLKVGDKAPDFKGIDQNGQKVSLKALLGKTIILYFYPKDDTPGCTAEACSLRDEYKFLTKKNYAVVGVSADDEQKHLKFATKYSLPFPLIADTNKAVINAYGVYGTKQFMGKIYDGIIRTTFIIDPKGKIQNVIKEVNTKQHAKQILDL